MSDHIIDQSVLIPDTGGLELSLILLLVDLGEDILEATIVRLENGVLRRHVEWELALQCILERRVSEVNDRLIGVVHRHGD